MELKVIFKISLFFTIIFSQNIFAEWKYMGISEGLAGEGKGDELYIWNNIKKDGDKRTFPMLINYKIPLNGERSSVTEVVTFCERPHRAMLGDSEGFSKKFAKGQSFGVEKGGWWLTLPSRSILRKTVDFACP